MAVLFEERQRFIGHGLIQAVLTVMAAATLAFWLWTRGSTGAPPLILSGPLLVLVMVVWMELHVVVRPEVVDVHMRPFRHRIIGVGDIAEAAARTYRPIHEYNGWGIRYGLGGMAYNVRGDRGVQLVLKDGRRVLIGSQRAEALAKAIAEAKAAGR